MKRKQPDLHELITRAKHLYSERQYNSVAIYCGMAIEILLHELYFRLLAKVPSGADRRRLVEMELKIGRGHGIERYTLGSIAHFCRQADFLQLAEDLLDVELGAARDIDFTPLVHVRNQAAHSVDEISQGAAGMILFQTTTLFECLRIAIADTHGVDEAISHRPNITSEDLAYIQYRVAQIAQCVPPFAESVPEQCQEALKYSAINPEDALFKLRKILEFAVRKIYQAKCADPRSATLDKLMTRLSEKQLIPNRIYKHMENVKSFGNRGAHPAEEAFYLKDVETVFLSLLVVLEWFFENAMEN